MAKRKGHNCPRRAWEISCKYTVKTQGSWLPFHRFIFPQLKKNNYIARYNMVSGFRYIFFIYICMWSVYFFLCMCVCMRACAPVHIHNCSQVMWYFKFQPGLRFPSPWQTSVPGGEQQASVAGWAGVTASACLAWERTAWGFQMK